MHYRYWPLSVFVNAVVRLHTGSARWQQSVQKVTLAAGQGSTTSITCWLGGNSMGCGAESFTSFLFTCSCCALL